MTRTFQHGQACSRSIRSRSEEDRSVVEKHGVIWAELHGIMVSHLKLRKQSHSRARFIDSVLLVPHCPTVIFLPVSEVHIESLQLI